MGDAEEEAGVAVVMEAAVQVSVTGQSLLFICMTLEGMVRMWPGGSEGFIRGGEL